MDYTPPPYDFSTSAEDRAWGESIGISAPELVHELAEGMTFTSHVQMGSFALPYPYMAMHETQDGNWLCEIVPAVKEGFGQLRDDSLIGQSLEMQADWILDRVNIGLQKAWDSAVFSAKWEFKALEILSAVKEGRGVYQRDCLRGPEHVSWSDEPVYSALHDADGNVIFGAVRYRAEVVSASEVVLEEDALVGDVWRKHPEAVAHMQMNYPRRLRFIITPYRDQYETEDVYNKVVLLPPIHFFTDKDMDSQTIIRLKD